MRSFGKLLTYPDAMKEEQWDLVKSIVDKALTLSGSEKDTYLSTACSDNPEISAEVEELLQSIEESGRKKFLKPVRQDYEELLSDLAYHLDKDAGEMEFIGRELGPYCITEKLGGGGMGAVFKGERVDGEFNHQVAIKLIKKGVDSEETIRRFRMEREILAGLHHPNIAQLYDGGVTDHGIPYLIMEYIDGLPIDRYCNENRHTVNERLALFKDICAVIQFAHTNLVIHRDLKAQNIYVTTEGTVKILDFGIAKLLNTENSEITLLETRAGQKFWTPQYAAPEQVKGERITTAVDIYALGILLHKLLTDTYPLDLKGKSIAEVEKIIEETAPLSPSQSVSNYPDQKECAIRRKTTPAELLKTLGGDLDALVLKAIRKEPEYRYASTSQFTEDIERHKSGMPLIARKGTLRYRTAKFMRRHKASLAVTIFFLITAISFAVFYTWKITEERDRVQVAAEKARLELAKAEQVTGFVINLFEANDPSEALGDTITAGELLRRGVERVEELEQQPEVQAQMMSVIGEVYKNLGRYDDARVLLEKALHAQRSLYKEEYSSAASSMNSLASLEHLEGNYEHSERLYRETLAIQKKRYDDDHINVAEIKNNLAGLMHTMGRTEDALKLYTEALPAYQKKFGKEHSHTTAVRNNIGLLHKDLGNYAEAEALLRETLNSYRRTLDENHPRMATGLNYLAVVLYMQGIYDESETLLLEALEIRRRVYGENHPLTLTTMNDLAAVMYATENYDKAEQLFRNVLDLRKETLGATHSLVAQSLNNLAAVLRKRGSYREAEPLYREAIILAQERYGTEHPKTGTSIANLGMLLTDMGRLKDAEKLLRRGLQIRMKVLPERHPEIALSEGALGDCLVRLNRFAEAEPLILQSFTTLKKKYGTTYPRTQQTLKSLVTLYENWEKPEMAESYKKKLALAEVNK